MSFFKIEKAIKKLFFYGLPKDASQRYEA